MEIILLSIITSGIVSFLMMKLQMKMSLLLDFLKKRVGESKDYSDRQILQKFLPNAVITARPLSISIESTSGYFLMLFGS